MYKIHGWWLRNEYIIHDICMILQANTLIWQAPSQHYPSPPPLPARYHGVTSSQCPSRHADGRVPVHVGHPAFHSWPCWIPHSWGYLRSHREEPLGTWKTAEPHPNVHIWFYVIYFILPVSLYLSIYLSIYLSLFLFLFYTPLHPTISFYFNFILLWDLSSCDGLPF